MTQHSTAQHSTAQQKRQQGALCIKRFKQGSLVSNGSKLLVLLLLHPLLLFSVICWAGVLCCPAITKHY
jgi:hypothetical protein